MERDGEEHELCGMMAGGVLRLVLDFLIVSGMHLFSTRALTVHVITTADH